MPTTSQIQVQRSFSRTQPDEVTYIPPTESVFRSAGHRRRAASDPLTLEPEAGQQKTYFPDMACLTAPLRCVEEVSKMSADDVMSRLHGLGWREEGKAVRLAERGKREEEKRRQTEEERQRRRQHLDLVNDPILRRVAKKNQAVPHYTKPPDSRPFAVCCDVKGPALTHSAVLKTLDALLAEMDGDIKVESLEFQPRSAVLNDPEAENRWVATLSSQYAVSLVNGTKATLGAAEVIVRSYDDVMNLEYKQFTSKSSFMKMLNKAD